MTSKTQALPLVEPVAINRSAWPRRLKGLVLPVLILLVLEVVVRVGWLPSYQMPAPSEIAVTLTDLAEGSLWKHISASLGRVLLGFAIGGGNVLCTICDLTIASEKAVFGQVGPKMGSVDPGYGTAFLARVVGEKKACEIWYLCRRYSAAEALAMGLVNAVVPPDQLDAEVQKWCDEITEKSPTAIAIAKRSFNMDTAHQSGIAGMGLYALKLYYDTEESREGVNAFQQKRKPDFRKYAK